jgi:hypothetical protein
MEFGILTMVPTWVLVHPKLPSLLWGPPKEECPMPSRHQEVLDNLTLEWGRGRVFSNEWQGTLIVDFGQSEQYR